MSSSRIVERYRELQGYVGWTDADAERVHAVQPRIESYLPPLIDEFYVHILENETTRSLMARGPYDVERLKSLLLKWVRELLAGPYDASYVERRWRVGLRHVEIGLPQVYTNVAMSLLRTGLIRAIRATWTDDLGPLASRDATITSIHVLLDLDLALIEDAYHSEYSQRLQNHERLATLGQVAGGVAHELRNPLNVMKTSAFFLLHARAVTPQKTMEHLKRIERQIELADSVITALSNFARMPVPDLQPIPVADLIREAVESSPTRPDVELRLDLPPDLPHVMADRSQMRIVFSNLIRNAQDAMPDGGVLTISGRRNHPGLEIDVTDNGIGMAPDQLGRIMEPLYSTKARGLGLGLAITRSIVEKHQGEIHVKSVSGQGTTFSVDLLADDSRPSAGEPSS